MWIFGAWKCFAEKGRMFSAQHFLTLRLRLETQPESYARRKCIRTEAKGHVFGISMPTAKSKKALF
jgi:hypothetical protein